VAIQKYTNSVANGNEGDDPLWQQAVLHFLACSLDFPMGKCNIFGMTLRQLEDECLANNWERFRAEQIFYWLYNGFVGSFEEMLNVPKDLRIALANLYVIERLKLIERQESNDGTEKFLYELRDGYKIETVLIPFESAESVSTRRLTLCVSTQVGCALNCHFCATASMKLKRDLTCGEILGQYLGTQVATKKKVTNLVYMGMGEPLLNYEATMNSIEIISHEKTDGISANHMTVSTSGIAEAIKRMADENRKVKLAISLHSTHDEIRLQLMPINKKYSLAHILEAAEYYYRKTKKRITFEYILFNGLNDRDDDVQRLVKLTRRIPGKVNIIPFHPISTAYPTGIPMPLTSASPERITKFVNALRAKDVTVMLRSSSGKDIDAACGQLAVKYAGETC